MPKPRKSQIREIEYVPIALAPETLEQLVTLITSLVDFVPTLYVGKETTNARRDLRTRVNAR